MTDIYRMQFRGLHTMTERELKNAITGARKAGQIVRQWQDTDAEGTPVTLTSIAVREPDNEHELFLTYRYEPAPVNLIVTTSKGRTFTTANSPYDSRRRTGKTVRSILRGAEGYSGDPGALSATVRAVINAPLDTPVTDGATGITFRTESAT